MGRTIAKHWFHPYEVKKEKPKEKIILKNWEDTNAPFYYDQIPIYLNKIYRSIDIELKHKCTAKIPDKQCLPEIVVLEDFLEELKKHIANSPIYESVKYNIKYTELEKKKELPNLLNLIKSHKYFMHYLHIPKEKDGFWFCEGRFFTLEEIEKTKDEAIFKQLDTFVKNRNIDYMDFLEEWVGLIFHLSAEFLLFKKKVKVIFYSCDNCYRPGLFIKEKINEKEDDSEKIWGTVNIVDTIIYNCTINLNYSKISKKNRSRNNIIYYDNMPFNWEIFKEETDGAFILITEEIALENVIKEIKLKKNIYKFDFIISEFNPEKILNIIEDLQLNDFIDRICLYKVFLSNGENELKNKYKKIQGIYNTNDEIINFIHEKNQESEIFPTIQLITYKEYTNKYNSLHQLISEQYGQNEENCFKIAISFLKDFLLWYPKLKAKSSIKEKLNIESLLETLQTFKDINANEEDIIRLYTQESDSYYKDFNNWLNTSDPLAVQKTSWFIAGVMYSLNKYAEKNDKGLKKTLKLYRGIRSNLYDLLNYQRAKGKIICFPSFTSTSRNYEVAERFAFGEDNYKTIITIDYKHKKGFLPTAVDVSKLAIKEHEYEEECLFLPYSFFIIQDVEINHKEKTAKIELTSIGRKKILENYLKEGINLVYNEDGFMEEQIEKER